MLDFHMHVLPEMDDGSKSVDTSLSMLEMSAEYGVDTIAATSHFYAWNDDPSHFLLRREAAYERLISGIEQSGIQSPQILLGAEVRFFDGISMIDDLEELCLEGTNLLFLEMPFSPWQERMFHEVDAICRRGIKPVAAHIERYMDCQAKRMIQNFMGLDVYIQCNAEFFVSRRTSRKALQMFRNGQIQFLGSDAHNTTSRPPNLGPALDFVESKLGHGSIEYLEDFEALVVEENG